MHSPVYGERTGLSDVVCCVEHQAKQAESIKFTTHYGRAAGNDLRQGDRPTKPAVRVLWGVYHHRRIRSPSGTEGLHTTRGLFGLVFV